MFKQKKLFPQLSSFTNSFHSLCTVIEAAISKSLFNELFPVCHQGASSTNVLLRKVLAIVVNILSPKAFEADHLDSPNAIKRI